MIRKLKKADLPGMLEWMHDEKVNSNFRLDFASMTEERALDFIEHSFTEDNQNFAIVNDEDEYMGTISLKNISMKDKNAEYAIVSRSCAHGTGLAYKATMDILKYGFESLGLHRIYLNVLDENKRANAFYRKCGFVYEGKFHEHLNIRGAYCDLNWYGMTKNQFKNLNRK